MPYPLPKVKGLEVYFYISTLLHFVHLIKMIRSNLHRNVQFYPTYKIVLHLFSILFTPSAFTAQVFLPSTYNSRQKNPMRRYRQRCRQYSYLDMHMILKTIKSKEITCLGGTVLTISLLACVVVLSKTFFLKCCSVC